MAWYEQKSELTIIRLYIQPGAKRTEVVGILGEELKIKLATTPIDGRANAALLKYLAKSLDVTRSSIHLKQGEKSRHKVVEIHSRKIDPNTLLNELPI